jgi:hypothetical protein
MSLSTFVLGFLAFMLVFAGVGVWLDRLPPTTEEEDWRNNQW